MADGVTGGGGEEVRKGKFFDAEEMKTQDVCEGMGRVLVALRTQRPLVLCLTNDVVRNFTANLLLAAHAVPAMLADAEEAEEMMKSCAQGLLVNVGTYTEQQARTQRAAVRCAGELGIPWVLDPVAVGLLSARTRFCHEIMRLAPPTLIRGNASEIMALAGQNAVTRGPESTDDGLTALPAAQQLARSTGAAVLVTGAVDYATDGQTTEAISGGSELTTRVTGMGCAMGALAAALCAVADSPLQAAIIVARLFKMAAETAAQTTTRTGSYAVAFLDALNEMEGRTNGRAGRGEKEQP